jgi:hypothetical protein
MKKAKRKYNKQAKRTVYDRQGYPPMGTNAQLVEMWALTGYGCKVVLENNHKSRWES